MTCSRAVLQLLLLLTPSSAGIGSKQGSIVKLGEGPSREEFFELEKTVRTLQGEVRSLQQTKLGISQTDAAATPKTAVGRVVPQNIGKCNPFRSEVKNGGSLKTEDGAFVINRETLECNIFGTGPLRCSFTISKRRGEAFTVFGKNGSWATSQPRNQDQFYLWATGIEASHKYRLVGSVGEGKHIAGNATYPIQYEAVVNFWDKAMYHLEVRLAVPSEYHGADLPCCASEECVDSDYALQGPRDWDCKKCCLAQCFDVGAKQPGCPASGKYTDIIVRQNFVWSIGMKCMFIVDATSLPKRSQPLPYCGPKHVQSTVRMRLSID
jgi:hypothetical protein